MRAVSVPDAADTPQPQQGPVAREFASAVAQFCVASVSMMIGNKKAMTSLPLPCTVVLIQAVGTLALLQLPYCRQQTSDMKLGVARQWLPIAALFAFMLFTSLQSFVHAGVAAVLIFRNVGAILTTVVEFFVRGVRVNARIIAAEVLIVVGATLYGHGSVDFTPTGLYWIILNVCGQVAYGVLVKHLIDVHPHFKEMSKYTMSQYNNVLALPMVFFVLLIQGEHAVFAQKVGAVDTVGWGVIALTCVFGFMISTSGFGLQKLVSATSFLVINNLTKFFNILLGILLLEDRFVGVYDITGCVLALGAGFWYSYEQSRLSA